VPFTELLEQGAIVLEIRGRQVRVVEVLPVRHVGLSFLFFFLAAKRKLENNGKLPFSAGNYAPLAN